jgi:hypothetical protein
MHDDENCELCVPTAVLCENALAFARHDSNALCAGPGVSCAPPEATRYE